MEGIKLNKLEAVLRKLQPTAKLIRTINGVVDPKEILDTGLFDFEKTSLSSGWITELNKETHTPETEEYGISSFVYRRRTPFHPQRLSFFFSNWPEVVVRAKGVVWVAAEGDLAATISQAGSSIQFGPSGYWLATMPEDQQLEVLESEPEMKAKWDNQWGDRMNEIVFIGVSMDRAQIEARLDRCLLTVDELKQDWTAFNNPLPWPVEELLAAATEE